MTNLCTRSSSLLSMLYICIVFLFNFCPSLLSWLWMTPLYIWCVIQSVYVELLKNSASSTLFSSGNQRSIFLVVISIWDKFVYGIFGLAASIVFAWITYGSLFVAVKIISKGHVICLAFNSSAYFDLYFLVGLIFSWWICVLVQFLRS